MEGLILNWGSLSIVVVISGESFNLFHEDPLNNNQCLKVTEDQIY